MSNPIIVQYCDEIDRFVPGDRLVRRWLRPVFGRPMSHLAGVRRVVRNFLTGLERKGVDHLYNPGPFTRRGRNKVISFGIGEMGLAGVKPATPLICAVGFPYPADFPDLCERYNVRRLLHHSQWVLDFVKMAGLYDEAIFDLWPAGIDTDFWRPAPAKAKSFDVLVYQKVIWDRESREQDLVRPIEAALAARGIDTRRINYGSYSPSEYRHALAGARAMVFLSPHESQGIAYQECLSCGVPVLAWNQGRWLDPAQKAWGLDNVPASSVPFFDERCGATFLNLADFDSAFDSFWETVRRNGFAPREYMLENLTIEKSTDRMLEIYDAI